MTDIVTYIYVYFFFFFLYSQVYRDGSFAMILFHSPTESATIYVSTTDSYLPVVIKDFLPIPSDQPEVFSIIPSSLQGVTGNVPVAIPDKKFEVKIEAARNKAIVEAVMFFTNNVKQAKVITKAGESEYVSIYRFMKLPCSHPWQDCSCKT